ncbi:MAG: hypothetical protein A2Y33_12790 [Spirochaetes bacterium GWF1_51_8]|nr:MAG: hypothetical protein A2Y33_12790 [Spirochaetes bacterium GWF1_51_8]
MIRLAKLDDVPAMAALMREAWQTAYDGLIDPAYPPTIRAEKYIEEFTKNISEKRERMTVYEKDGKIAGLCGGRLRPGDEFDCEIHCLYVYPVYQGQGIGSALFAEMKEFFIAERCAWMIVFTFYGAKNNNFYTKMGGDIERYEDGEAGGKKYPGAAFTWQLEKFDD